MLLAYSNNDGWLVGQSVRHIDVHVDVCRVGPEVPNLLEGGSEAAARHGGEPKQGREEHDDRRR